MASSIAFEERAPHERGFAEVFATRIRPILEDAAEEARALRKKGKRNAAIAVAIGVVAAGAAFVFIDADSPQRIAAPGLIAVVTVIAALFAYHSAGAAFNRSIAETVGPILCGFMGYDFYHHQIGPGFVDPHRFSALKLTGSYTSASLQDGIEGTWRGVPFRMVEAKLTRRSGTGKNRRTVVVFDGILMQVETPAEMPKIVFLRDSGAVAGWVREKLSLSSDLKRLPFPDPEVEAAYRVYTDDVAAAQAAISPAFGRTLLTLREEHQGARGYLAAGFEGRTLSLGFRKSGDFFRLALYGTDPAEFPERCRAALADLMMPRRVIDTLVGPPGDNAGSA